MKLVLVRWLDIVVENGWTAIDEATKLRPHAVETVGFLVYEDEHRLVVAHSISGKEVNPYTAIPRGCIESITILSVPARKRSRGEPKWTGSPT